MLSGKKFFTTVVSFIIVVSTMSGTVDAAESAIATKVSGGENHTLVLTASNSVWACGPNGGPGPYYGVLGTGSNDPGLTEWTLTRVHALDDVGYLEDVDNIDAGWKHSLALEISAFVWAWGDNEFGELVKAHPQVLLP